MKKIALTIAVAVCVVSSSLAADNATTNYLAGYRYVAAAAATNTVTDIGLATNTAYVCIPVASLTDCTEAKASTTTNSDVRAVIYGIAQTYFLAYDASTNKTPSAITRAVDYSASGTNTQEAITHVLRTYRILGAGSLP